MQSCTGSFRDLDVSATWSEKRVDIHEALLSLSCVWICWKSLGKHWITA